MVLMMLSVRSKKAAAWFVVCALPMMMSIQARIHSAMMIGRKIMIAVTLFRT